MDIPIYQVDAFTSEIFSGNPAAVCPLEEWLDPATMQLIAAENNLSETAFFVDEGARYGLRWFTPAAEIDFCGHATVASAWVILNILDPSARTARFSAQCGPLAVHKEGDLLAMDAPSWTPEPCNAPRALLEGLGKAPGKVLASRDYLCVYDSPGDVAALAPDMALLAGLDRFGIIATAPGGDEYGVDFVSRFFAPGLGIPEDPVTGSAHSTLIPYWAGRLGKEELTARQISKRGGELFCRLQGERVTTAGKAALYLTGKLHL